MEAAHEARCRRQPQLKEREMVSEAFDKFVVYTLVVAIVIVSVAIVVEEVLGG